MEAGCLWAPVVPRAAVPARFTNTTCAIAVSVFGSPVYSRWDLYSECHNSACRAVCSLRDGRCHSCRLGGRRGGYAVCASGPAPTDVLPFDVRRAWRHAAGDRGGRSRAAVGDSPRRRRVLKLRGVGGCERLSVLWMGGTRPAHLPRICQSRAVRLGATERRSSRHARGRGSATARPPRRGLWCCLWSGSPSHAATAIARPRCPMPAGPVTTGAQRSHSTLCRLGVNVAIVQI